MFGVVGVSDVWVDFPPPLSPFASPLAPFGVGFDEDAVLVRDGVEGLPNSSLFFPLRFPLPSSLAGAAKATLSP